ncbi:MAG TPA: phosphatidate cytidylyltransferase [Thermodesulfobacteriota bacterium]|nr:phosphatidate cytidylyltransferase [Thermodesulfobacteriota bacterium]
MISGVEIRRKMVHLATLTIPIGYEVTSQETVLFFVIPLFLGLLAVDLLRQFHPGMASLFKRFFFGRVLRENEQPSLMGSTYFLFSTILAILLFPKSIAVTSLLILILSDTAAALVGKGIGKTHLFGKTLEGSMAFFFTSLLIVWLYPHLNRLSGTLAALGGTLIELLPIRLNDNLSIPLVTGAIMLFGGA